MIQRLASLCLLPALLLAASLLGCDASSPAPATQAAHQVKSPYTVVCTVAMVTDIVRHIAGDHAEVRGLIGAGVDPHLYKPTRDDVAALDRADVVFYSGLMLEGKMIDTLEKMAAKKPVYAVTAALSSSELLADPEHPGHHDPHVWMDVSLWARAAEGVAETLAKLDPDNAEDYRRRGRDYAAQCAELHTYGRTLLATVPETGRVLITSHDAFGYFGRAYGIEVLGVQGISTESEAGLSDINALVDLIVQRGVKAVFVESSVPTKNVQALIEGARSRGHEVIIGGELFSDAMGAEGTYEGTYLGMLDHNFTLVARALGGVAPERGRIDRLSP